MHVLVNGSWQSGFLDQMPTEGESLVTVHRQVALVPVHGQFFVRERNSAMLMSYVASLGPRRVLRKVMSRRREAVRNYAWLSVGLGSVVGDPSSRVVVFVAPTAPPASERIVVDDDMLYRLQHHHLADYQPAHFVNSDPSAGVTQFSGPVRDEILPWAGWRREQGVTPVWGGLYWDEVVRVIEDPPTSVARTPARPPASAVSHRHEPSEDHLPPIERPRLHVFGYGQYAKTQIIPNLRQDLSLDCVHEIDSLQIGPMAPKSSHSWDTRGHPVEGELIQNAVIAGYHHTHSPLAAALLERGTRHVIIEKPVSTTDEQLDRLLAALDRRPEARVHVGFQRRYSPFNDHLNEDLGGPPISMSATIYEVPLPARHWYRWPVVGNSVVSNGCHWVDHFLYLNQFADVSHAGVQRLLTQTVLTLELANGASAVLSLRHLGAPRRGVRDLCVFWNGESSAVIEDGRRYTSERGYRRIRRVKAHPYSAIEAMYREFGRRIVGDEPGDTRQAIEVPTRAILNLARQLDGLT